MLFIYNKINNSKDFQKLYFELGKNYIELSKVNVSFRIASTANQCKIWEHDEILSHQNEYGAYPATNMKSGSKKKKGRRVYQNPKCRICKYRRPRRKDGTCPCRG